MRPRGRCKRKNNALGTYIKIILTTYLLPSRWSKSLISRAARGRRGAELFYYHYKKLRQEISFDIPAAGYISIANALSAFQRILSNGGRFSTLLTMAFLSVFTPKRWIPRTILAVAERFRAVNFFFRVNIHTVGPHQALCFESDYLRGWGYIFLLHIHILIEFAIHSLIISRKSYVRSGCKHPFLLSPHDDRTNRR